uniref:Si:dkey-103g5.3 n=1 Tax=Gasterosteus aculeatus aculeatus TaxID=481459 RepID=A0AAQ4NPK3_GASAC
MILHLCLPLLVGLLHPALCVYNCSSQYERIPDNSDVTVVCGARTITLEINLCTAQWAGFSITDLALNGNHNASECQGSMDNRVDPPVIRYQLPVNHSQENPCRQSLQVRTCPFSSFLSIQAAIITGFIDTPGSDQGLISYSTDLYYHFSCRYPLEYLINNTQIVASSVSVASSNNSGTFIDTLRMSVYNDSDHAYPLVVPSTGLELRTKIYVEVKAVNLTGNFHVLLDHCFGHLSSLNITNVDGIQIFLLSARCSVDPRTSVTSNGLSNVAWFNFEAFRFVQHRSQDVSSIYLHCIMRLCEPSKCQELLSRRKRSVSPFGEESSESATVTVGPLYTAAVEGKKPAKYTV